MDTATRTPFREDRQFGEPYADDEQVYRTIGLTNAQLQRLPMWARLAIARADATIIRRDNTIAALLAALERIADWCDVLRDVLKQSNDGELAAETRRVRAAITAARGTDA